MPATFVYRVKFFSIASIAASLICRGVEKCGSPAPKSARFTPSDFNFSAAAVIAIVAETSMRPMRSANILVAVAVLMSLVCQIYPAR